MRALLIVENPTRQTALADWLRRHRDVELVSCIGFSELETLCSQLAEHGAQLLIMAKASSYELAMAQLEKAWHCARELPIVLLPCLEQIDGNAADHRQAAFEHAVRVISAGIRPMPQPSALGDAFADAEEEARKLDLTLRQYQILVLLSMGHQQKVISRMLDISLATVKSHSGQLYQRLGARNKAEAIYAARQRGAQLAWPDAQAPDRPA
jgi:Response regulator containing a CheY-like receiver domain and an HTH DNA-binding domain